MEWSDFCKYDGNMNHGPICYGREEREREREREKGGISSFALVEDRRHASCRVQTCFFTPVNGEDAV